jgi:hypothetical protein
MTLYAGAGGLSPAKLLLTVKCTVGATSRRLPPSAILASSALPNAALTILFTVSAF